MDWIVLGLDQQLYKHGIALSLDWIICPWIVRTETTSTIPYHAAHPEPGSELPGSSAVHGARGTSTICVNTGVRLWPEKPKPKNSMYAV